MRIERDRDNFRLSAIEVEKELRSGEPVRFVWPDTIEKEAEFLTEDLTLVDRLAKGYGELVKVTLGTSFFDTQVLDCRLLQQLPNVQTLALSSRQMDHVETLRDLKHLRSLSISSYLSMPPDVLVGPHTRDIHTLNFGETENGDVDLGPIAQMMRLTDLSVVGRSKNIEAIGAARNLLHLKLTKIPKTVDLSFVNRLQKLESFRLLFGGRKTIDEIELPNLKILDIDQVLGFNSIDLRSFPSLAQFGIADQKQIERLDFYSEHKSLETITIFQLKGLRSLTGLPFLKRLNRLCVFKTQLDFDHLCTRGFPPSLEYFAFENDRVGEDARIRGKLDAMGYRDAVIQS